MKKRKRRSIAASRAASLKGWRTRKVMKKVNEAARIQLEIMGWNKAAAIVQHASRQTIFPTIDRVPKVEWK